MKQFINGSNRQFLDLERKAYRSCIAFSDQELPSTVSPATGRIGFRVFPTTNAAFLYLDRGKTYSGKNETIRRWIESGQLRFPTFLSLRLWIQRELSAEFTVEKPAATPEPKTPLLLPAPRAFSEPDPHPRLTLGLSSTEVLIETAEQAGLTLDPADISDELIEGLDDLIREESQREPREVILEAIGDTFEKVAAQGTKRIKVIGGLPVSPTPRRGRPRKQTTTA